MPPHGEQRAMLLRGSVISKGKYPKHREALDCYNRGLALSIGGDREMRARLLSCRAHVQLLLGGRSYAEAALQDCKSALQDLPSDAKTWWRAAMACQGLGLPETAVDFCERGLSSCGEDAELRRYLHELRARHQELGLHVLNLCQRGVAFGRRGDHEEALVVFQAAVALDPKNADAQVGLGIAAERLGKQEDALQAFRAAAQADPRNPVACYNAAVALERHATGAEELFEAEVALHTACALEPQNPEYQSQLGVVLMRQQRLPAAKAAFACALRIQPGHEAASANIKLCERSCDSVCNVALGRDPDQDVDLVNSLPSWLEGADDLSF